MDGRDLQALVQHSVKSRDASVMEISACSKNKLASIYTVHAAMELISEHNPETHECLWNQ